MKTIIPATIFTATLYWLALLTFSAEREDLFARPTGPALNALQILEAATRDLAGPEESGEVLAAAVREALKVLPKPSLASERLVSAITTHQEEGKAEDLVQAVKEVSLMLSFQPRIEAELPEGFPTYTPVGVIEVKEYPAYRMAVAGKFWTLFRHIQSNDISMTAPVEMKYASNSSGKLSQQSMAFLYGNAEIGELGKNGEVNVVDVQPLTVVSIGVRGRRSQATVERAHQYLMRWIKANSDLEASGSPRVMGYNSPMVRQADSFFEVQVPVRKLRAKASQ